VGNCFRHEALGAVRRGGEVEAEEEGVQADVGRPQLGENTALGAAQVAVHPRDGVGWSGVVKEGDAVIA
jgi:hypothetical protein